MPEPAAARRVPPPPGTPLPRGRALQRLVTAVVLVAVRSATVGAFVFVDLGVDSGLAAAAQDFVAGGLLAVVLAVSVLWPVGLGALALVWPLVALADRRVGVELADGRAHDVAVRRGTWTVLGVLVGIELVIAVVLTPTWGEPSADAVAQLGQAGPTADLLPFVVSLLVAVVLGRLVLRVGLGRD